MFNSKYHLILKNKNLAYMESIGNFRLNYIFKEVQELTLFLVCIQYIKRSPEVMQISL